MAGGVPPSVVTLLGTLLSIGPSTQTRWRWLLVYGGLFAMYKTWGLALDSWTVDYQIGMVGLPCDESCVDPDTHYYKVAWDIAVPTHPLCAFLVTRI